MKQIITRIITYKNYTRDHRQAISGLWAVDFTVHSVIWTTTPIFKLVDYQQAILAQGHSLGKWVGVFNERL